MTFAKSKVVYMDEALNVAEQKKRTGHPFDQTYGLKALGRNRRMGYSGRTWKYES